ncbi:D-arabinono-1,4-lactone oxidase [Cyclobacterium jeungdonense]|uniref:D-arabinono-1,4-lactone oxidase n=1 Tax=Cyclobacterium jeungdonense TaxID=708087 RepID=A0ABT8CCV0_9BACT|nr:D-arabinono-1,4-lactone oxidase [Cyclobacterium jeungdonense]MDN3690625.1 D-arabinono-1,4-lactone oxidase [Cyclobacterium jeungdonense]
MKKRQFLKKTSIVIGTNLILPMVGCESGKQVQSGPARVNWAGNLRYSTPNLDIPADRNSLRQVIKKTDNVKVLGTMHSFNTIADSEHQQVSLEDLDPDIQLDTAGRTVTVSGGVQYGVLARKLHEQGFALHNLASLPHISVAGACATATHGSGDKNGNLSTTVTAMEMVMADGELLVLNEVQNPEEFKAAVVHLGALGIVTRISLKIQPTFNVRQYVYENLSLKQLGANFDPVFSSGYSVSLFTDWQEKRFNQLWIKQQDDGGDVEEMPEEIFGASAAKTHLHPIKEISAVNCTEQMGIPGPWHERLPHFKMDFTPSSGEELQSEYFVPREHAVEALAAIFSLGEAIFPYLLISEIRSIRKDSLWLSTAYERESIAIHFTWKQDWENVQKLLPEIEKELMPFGVRPHWGKLFALEPTYLRDQYERMEDFTSLMKKMDPQEKFVNDFLKRNLLNKA